MPHPGQPGAPAGRGTRAGVGAGAVGLVAEPDRAPLREPGYEELPGQGGDQVLVELSGEQFGGFREEGQRAPVDPVLAALTARTVLRAGALLAAPGARSGAVGDAGREGGRRAGGQRSGRSGVCPGAAPPVSSPGSGQPGPVGRGPPGSEPAITPYPATASYPGIASSGRASGPAAGWSGRWAGSRAQTVLVPER